MEEAKKPLRYSELLEQAERTVGQREEWRPSSEYYLHALGYAFAFVLAAITASSLSSSFKGFIAIGSIAMGLMAWLHGRERYNRWTKAVDFEIETLRAKARNSPPA